MGGGGLAIGGGGLIGIVFLLIQVLGGGGGGSTAHDFQQPSAGVDDGAGLSQECRTGADANQREDCRIVGVVNSVQEFWSDELGGQYQEAQTVFFSGGTNT